MHSVTSLVCLSVFLLAVTAEFPNLSQSYSLTGNIIRTVGGVIITPGNYSVAVDFTRGLQLVDETLLRSGGNENTITLSSENGDYTYESSDGVCLKRSYRSNSYFPLYRNVWDRFAAGTEDPVGTYTYTFAGAFTYQVTIVDDLPTEFYFANGGASGITFLITVTNFYNTTPPLSTFSLPSACSRYNCTECNTSPPFPSLSPSYSFTGNSIETVGSSITTPGNYSVAVDFTRRLQLVDERQLRSGRNYDYITLSSENDDTTYESSNGVCIERSYRNNWYFPLYYNVWDRFAAGTEGPVGTYTVTSGASTDQVTIVDGLPTEFYFAFGGVDGIGFLVTVTNFYNVTPPLSTFSLPNECSRYNCTECYSSAPFPSLSPSYSFTGHFIRRESGVVTSTGDYSVAVDFTQILQLVDETLLRSGGNSNTITLSSENGNYTYESSDGVCLKRSYRSNSYFPLCYNVWDRYAAGTEDPVGTYTFKSPAITYQVTIVDGLPTEYIFTFGTTELNITVTNFYNATPPSSTFSLPNECSRYNCTECNTSPPFPSLSPSYSLRGNFIRRDSGVVTSTGDYSVTLDISRRIQYVDERLDIGGIISNNIRPSNDNDEPKYLSVDNFYNQISYNPNAYFPLYYNMWDSYATGTEAPTGTYTFTSGSITYQVTIVNDSPTEFIFTFGTTELNITVTNFYNATPVFSTFSLPNECSIYTCNACYSSAGELMGSLVLLLCALFMYLFTTV